MTLRSIAARLRKIAIPVDTVVEIHDRLKRELPGLCWEYEQQGAEYTYSGCVDDEVWAVVRVFFDYEEIQSIRYEVLEEDGIIADSYSTNEQKVNDVLGVMVREIKQIMPDELLEETEEHPQG